MRLTSSWLLLAGLVVGAASLPQNARAADGIERTWKAKCASCHGQDGKGKTKQGDKMGIGDMTSAAWQKEFTDDKIKKTITDGLKRDKDGKAQEMKGLKDKLTPEEVDQLVAFIRTLK